MATGHCDLFHGLVILPYHSVNMHTFYHNISEYDQTFDPKVVSGNYDLISWLSNYLDTQLIYFHTSFRL